MSCNSCISQLRDHGQEDAARKLSDFQTREHLARIEALGLHARWRINRMLQETGASLASVEHLDPMVVVAMADQHDVDRVSTQAVPTPPATKPKVALATERTAVQTKQLTPAEGAKLLSDAVKSHQASGLSYDQAWTLSLSEQKARTVAVRANRSPAQVRPKLGLAERAKTIQMRENLTWDQAFDKALHGDDIA